LQGPKRFALAAGINSRAIGPLHRMSDDTIEEEVKAFA
jgi:hypothetical protein